MNFPHILQLQQAVLVTTLAAVSACTEEPGTAEAFTIIEKISNSCMKVVVEGEQVLNTLGDSFFQYQNNGCLCVKTAYSLGCMVSQDQIYTSFAARLDSVSPTVLVGFPQGAFGFVHQADGNCYRGPADLKTMTLKLSDTELISHGGSIGKVGAVGTEWKNFDSDCSRLAEFAYESGDNILWHMEREHPAAEPVNRSIKKPL